MWQLDECAWQKSLGDWGGSDTLIGFGLAADVLVVVNAPHAQGIQEGQPLVQLRIYMDDCRMATEGQEDEISAQQAGVTSN